jgi:hypothetical protein
MKWLHLKSLHFIDGETEAQEKLWTDWDHAGINARKSTHWLQWGFILPIRWQEDLLRILLSVIFCYCCTNHPHTPCYKAINMYCLVCSTWSSAGDQCVCAQRGVYVELVAPQWLLSLPLCSSLHGSSPPLAVQLKLLSMEGIFKEYSSRSSQPY